MPRMPPRLHLVTDAAALRRPAFLEAAGTILLELGAAVALQLRGRDIAGAELFRLASALGPGAREAGAMLLVNDRVDVALAVGGLGVQLRARSIPVRAARRLLADGQPIGYSAHGPEESARAVAEGADFVLFGTVFASASHPDGPTAGLAGLAAAVRSAGAPVLAIGGITPERVGAVLRAGAHGAAVLGGVWHVPNPIEAARRYGTAIEECTMGTATETIEITLNGEVRRVAAGGTVVDLLTGLGLHPRLVVVEHNREILDREGYAGTEVRDGDVLELVHFVGGG